MPVDRNFQRAAVALLLCAPSDLNIAWLAGDNAAVQAEMTRLGFHPDLTREMTTAFNNFRADEDLFDRMATLLKFGVWAGGEPHPNPDGSLRIVAAMKALDGD